MKKPLPIAFLILLLAGCTQPAPVSKAGDELPQPALLATPFSRPIKDNQIVVRMKSGSSLDGYAVQAEGSAGTVVVQCQKDEDLEATLEKLNDDPRVELAEPNYIYKIDAVTNDPLNKTLWNYPSARIFEAWDLGRGDPKIKVAVVDTGIDYRHPDLAGIVVKGHDYINGDEDPMDDNGHGTHCAGVIGAIADNNIGLAGVASGVSLIAIKVMDSEGSGPLSAVASGILEAKRLGANVINLSLGDSADSLILQSAIADAVNAGITVVAAAGNDNSSRKYYPAAYPGVISVAAMGTSDTKADFSNYGDWIKVAAPGQNIVSTTPGARYQAMSGTSMASPHVSGLAALLLSRDSSLTPGQVLNGIASSGRVASGFASRFKQIDAAAAMRANDAQPTPVPTLAPLPVQTAPPTPQPTIAPLDQNPPSVPTGLRAVASDGEILLTWDPSNDDRSVAFYQVYRNGLRLGTTTETSFIDHDAKPGLSYSYQVAARDGASNLSGKSGAASGCIQPASIRMMEVEVTTLSKNFARIHWLTDLPGSSRIEIREGNRMKEAFKAKLGRIHLVSLTGLKTGTTYQFKVSSTDASGHLVSSDLLSFVAK